MFLKATLGSDMLHQITHKASEVEAKVIRDRRQ